MTNNPVGWFEIYVQEIERAKKFYESVLKVNLQQLQAPGETSMEMYAFPMNFEGPGASGALVKMAGFTPGANSTLVYFSCDDCAIEAGRVVAAGGKLHSPKESIGEYGFCAVAIDTEGNMFGLHSMR